MYLKERNFNSNGISSWQGKASPVSYTSVSILLIKFEEKSSLYKFSQELAV